MGGTGSGRPTGSTNKKKTADAAKKNRTKETDTFVQQVDKQKGDRLWRVVRRYFSGKKQIVGEIGSTRPADVGAKFGGGEYELHELDRLDNETGKILKMDLHPGTYPFKKKFSQEVFELELQQLQDHEEGPMASGKSEKQLFDEALTQARKEFEGQLQMQALQQKIDGMQKQLEGGAGGGKQSFAEQAAGFFDLFKKLQPTPPATAPAPAAADPVAQMQNALKLVETLQGYAKKLPGAGGDGAVFERILGTMGNLANKALDTHLAERRAPVTPSNVPAATSSAPVDTLTTEDVEKMMQPLVERIASDQKQQLKTPPVGHISETAAYVKNLMNSSSATPALVNLRNSIKIHESDELVDYFGQFYPALVETDKHRAWLESLVDLCKQ